MRRKASSLIAIKNNCLLLVYKRDVWIPPGGKPEIGETLESCVKREGAEELSGCIASCLVPYGYFEAITPHKGDAIECWMFLGKIDGEVKASGEISNARWVPNQKLDTLPLSASMRQIVKSLRFTGHLT